MALGQISQVTGYLFLSGCAPIQNADLVRQKRITCVINATAEGNTTLPPSVVKELAEHVHVRIDDLPDSDISSYFDHVADKINAARKNRGRVLVHCGAGISRSPTLVMAYLVKHEKMTLRAAFLLVSSVRPIVGPNIGFWRQLIEYEKKVTGQTTVKLTPAKRKSMTLHSPRRRPTDKKQQEVEYVSLINSDAFKTEVALEPDVYSERGTFSRSSPRHMAEGYSRTLFSPKRFGYNPQSSSSTPGSPSSSRCRAYESKHLTRHASFTMLAEDWNGRLSQSGAQGGGHYYKKCHVPLMKRRVNGGVFDSFATICDTMLPGL